MARMTPRNAQYTACCRQSGKSACARTESHCIAIQIPKYGATTEQIIHSAPRRIDLDQVVVAAAFLRPLGIAFIATYQWVPIP